MKKLIAILFSVLMLCALIPFAAVSAADEPTIVAAADVEEVNAGDEFQVTVSLMNNPGVIAAIVEVEYDRNVFELVPFVEYDEDLDEDVEYGVEKATGWSTSACTFPEPGSGNCLLSFINGTAKKDVTKELFFTATFMVKDEAPSGTYNLTVVYDPANFFNLAGEDVVFGKQDATIKVNGSEPSCEHEYDNACDVDCNLCGETREVEHNVVAVEAKDATCTELGNIAYWYCDVCGQAWLDEACTQNTNLMAVKLPMVDHEYFYACDPVCMNCYEITNPDAAHSLSHVEAKDATCFENGNIEYWTCEHCGGCWDNEAATGMPLNQMMVVVPMAHDELTHVEAKAPTCFENGNIEYWYCEACGMAWLDAEGTLNTNLLAVVLPMAHDELTHVEAKEPTCTEEGNIEYWTCEACGYAWLDAEGTLNTNLQAVKLGASCKYTAVYTAAKDATCFEEGNTEYWYCANCDVYYADADCTIITNAKNVIIPVSHNVIHVEAKEPTCTEEGNIEYWYCDVCGSAWLDELCHLNTNLQAVKLGASCKYAAEYVEAKEATCYEPGNTEYWYCANCDVYYADADCTIITNAKNVIIPVSHNVIHVEAKDATCTELGNIEYWYCDICGQAWLDELCHLNTNLMSVKLPMADHTYDNVYDADCNVCGAIREIVLGADEIVIEGGKSVSEIKNGLAVKFDAYVDGITYNEEYIADYTNATVTIDGVEYKLVGMGAIANNKGYAAQTLDNVDGKYVLNIPAEKVFDEFSFAVRIINIPADKLDTEITFCSYFQYEDISGEIVTVYGDDIVASYNGVVNG